MQDLQKSIDEGNEKFPASSGGWFKPEEGANKFRVLSFPAVGGKHFSPSGYKGVCVGKDNNCPGCDEGKKPNAKWLTYIHFLNSLTFVPALICQPAIKLDSFRIV